MKVSGYSSEVSGTLALRANATAYTSGKIIAQSATAGSCSGIALAVGRVEDGIARTGMIRRARLKINDSTWLNAAVRVHFFKDAPTFTNADAGTFAAGISESSYLGYADVTLDQSFAGPFAKGIAAPAVGAEINFTPSADSQNIYAVLEARSSVTASASSKTFTLTLETLQD